MDEQKHDDISQKSKGSAKQDKARIKHNRNASQGIELPDLGAEAAKERDAEQKLVKRGHRVPELQKKQKREESRLKETVIALRRQGRTYKDITLMRGMPGEDQIRIWVDRDPEFAEAVKGAYDDYIRGIVEESLAVLPQIDDAPGIDNGILERADPGPIDAEDSPEVRAAKINAEGNYVRTAILHGRARSRAKRDRVMTALQIAERRLPAEWGRDRDQEQQVIVIETPGGWMMDAATAGLDDPNGQGAEAKAAAERWRKMRDVTP